MNADRHIAQTLHGYSSGHRLLASSASLAAREQVLLDRLSDLSGYLPPEVSFSSYHTGFACGRYYALACTWPDQAAQRGGTVVTHTLLIPTGLLGTVHDLNALYALHRQPLPGDDLSSYGQDIPWLEMPDLAPSPPEATRARAALALLFGQTERPILWCESEPAEEIAAYLWSALWTETRRDFAFCTLALQVRSLDSLPFSFLGLPPAARGSFFRLYNSQAWWLNQQLPSAGLRALAGESWVSALYEVSQRRVSATQLIRDQTLQQGLRPPAASEIPLLHRFQELGPRARGSVAAAAARADLLDRYQPDPDCPAWSAVLRDLVEQQEQAPLGSRPLWHLIDLLQRPQLGPLAAKDAALRGAVEQTLKDELPRRLVVEPAATSAEVLGLWQLASAAGWSDAVADALRQVARQLPERLVALAREMTGESGQETLLAAILNALPASDRLELSLSLEEPTLRLLAVLAAGQAADELQLSLPELMGKLDRSAIAIDLLRLRAVGSSSEALSEALRGQPRLAQAIIERSVSGDCDGSDEGLLWAAVESLSAGEIVRRGAAWLERAYGTNREAPLAGRVGRALHQHLIGAGPDLEAAGSLLSRPAIRRYFEQSQEWVPQPVWRQPASYLQDLADSIRRSVDAAGIGETESGKPPAADLPSGTGWIDGLLRPLLQQCSREQLDRAALALAKLVVAAPTERGDLLPFKVALFQSADWNRPPRGYLIVEAVFPGLYQLILSGQASIEIRHLIPAWFGWDLARTWRHWLLDTYRYQSWPPGSLLQVIQSDLDLMRRVIKRATKTRAGASYLRPIAPQLLSEPRLLSCRGEIMERFHLLD